jgi:hypothetical protein
MNRPNFFEVQSGARCELLTRNAGGKGGNLGLKIKNLSIKARTTGMRQSDRMASYSSACFGKIAGNRSWVFLVDRACRLARGAGMEKKRGNRGSYQSGTELDILKKRKLASVKGKVAWKWTWP